MSTVISIEHLSKAYRLGQIGTPLQENASTGPAAGTLSYDLKLWWAKMLGKANPLAKIGENDGGTVLRPLHAHRPAIVHRAQVEGIRRLNSGALS